jgi:2-polyprenyl-3-methyl-5-hydroxy-6-metoxy-1,4-benzoquinol methylase
MSKVLKILQLSIRHSYLNKKFKYHLRNALPFGWLAYTVLRHKEGITQHTIRHLPPPLPFKNKLLDIGCGGGDFLMTATLLGYAAEGLEIDPAACNIARQRGVKVKLGAVPNSQLAPNQFDFITLNHVVEHFHDPVASLLEIHKLLTPNGRVWIKVPNLNASSRSYLGENACLLDSPRHLVMFDLNSISNLLQQTGFHVQAIIKPSWEDERDSYCGGWMVKNGFGLQSISHCKPPMAVFRAALSAYKKPGHSSENGEVVTIIAQKQTTQPVL